MSRSKLMTTLAIGAIASGCAAPGAREERLPPGHFDIGRVATTAEIRGWDIDVRPDGAGLPPGSGTAVEGRKIYEAKCAACHGAAGEGGTAPRLAGGAGTLTSKKPVQTVGSYWPYATTVYDYVYRSMPWNAPLSLTPNEVYSVTAYLLHLNKIIDERAVMDAKSLPAVQMPNRKSFVTPEKDPAVQGERCMRDCPAVGAAS